jgi:hypothetical protein
MRCAFLVGVLVVATACSNDVAAPISTRNFTISAAVSSGGMAVTSTTPDSATQDTTLDVTINGSGFVSGSVATWQFNGVSDPLQVRTNSTRYVSAKKLVANITVSSSATIGKWDVQVAAAGGKGGIGTEVFAIKLRGNVDAHSRVNYVLADQVDIGGVLQPAGIRGDGRLRDGSSSAGNPSEYQGEFCGVTGVIANDVRESGMLSMDPGDGTSTACGGPRYYVFNLNGTLRNFAPLHRIFDFWSIAVGETRNVSQGFGIDITDCGILMFSSQYGGDNMKVTRLDNGVGPRKWRIESQGGHIAACVIIPKQGPVTYKATGIRYYLPFSILVTEVPYPFPVYP